jgi:chemotaxis protein CheZ
MKLMENNLPKTSGALEAVSKMTEEAAHKILGVLESAIGTNQEVRNRLSFLKEHPETLDQTLSSVHTLLEEEEGRIMQGFEAMVFQDLVGQNIRQMTRTLNELEKKLLEILIEFSPSASKEETPPDKVTDSPIPGIDLKGVPGQSAISQDSVDQLLSEFGF